MSESKEDRISKGPQQRNVARPSSASKGNESVAIGELFVRAAAGGRRGDFFNNLRQLNKNSKLGKASNFVDTSGGRGPWQPPAAVVAANTNVARWRAPSPGGPRSEVRAASLPQRAMYGISGAASPRSPQSPQPLLPCSRPLMTQHLLPRSMLDANLNGSSSEPALDGSPRPILSALSHSQQSGGSVRSHSHTNATDKMPRKRVTWSEECKAPPPTSMLALLRGISGDSNSSKPRTPPSEAIMGGSRLTRLSSPRTQLSPERVLARAGEANISGSRRSLVSSPRV